MDRQTDIQTKKLIIDKKIANGWMDEKQIDKETKRKIDQGCMSRQIHILTYRSWLASMDRQTNRQTDKQ
jgi:hypothetical protein